MTFHERARALMNRSVASGIDAPDQEWLNAHLLLCQQCCDHREALLETINGVRHSLGEIAIPSSLVRSTQSAVRHRAAELQRQQERMSPLWIACALAGLWALLSIPLIWEGTRWVASHTNVSMYVWQTAAVFVWLMPTGAAVALGVWARGLQAIEA